MKKLSIKFLVLTIATITFGIFSISSFAQTAQFEYDLKITADPVKRAAYLKQSGEAPILVNNFLTW